MADEHRVKMFFALKSYQFRTAMRRSSLASWVVLFVALFISLAILVEPLQAPFRAVGIDFPSLTRYEVVGTVRDANDEPIPGVRVAAGGYSTSTDTAGAYTLRLAAESPNGVVIVFSRGSKHEVRFVDFTGDTTVKLDEKIR